MKRVNNREPFSRRAPWAWLLAALLLGWFMCINTVAANTDWYRDAKYGLMLHFLVSGPVDNMNSQVNSFNVQGLADQLDQAGAGFAILTLGQNSGYYCAPNSTYDGYVGHSPSYCATNDLVLRLAPALKAKGIRLFLYLPSGAPSGDSQAMAKLQYTPGPARNAEFQVKWQNIIQEWSLRYGTNIAGWWFDGCYWAQDLYDFSSPPNFASFAAAARAGNPASILFFNDGGGPFPDHTLTESGDASAGEIWPQGIPFSALPICTNRWVTATDPVSGHTYQVQWNVHTYLGHNFAGNGYGGLADQPRFSDAQVVNYVQQQNAQGGVVQLDVPIQIGGLNSGLLSTNFLTQLRLLKSAIRGTAVSLPNLALQGQVSASSQSLTSTAPQLAVDNLTNTCWASASSDSHAWWQVDLGTNCRVSAIQIVARQDLNQVSARVNFQVRASNDPGFSRYVVLASQGAMPYPNLGSWLGWPTNTAAYRYVRAAKTDGAAFSFAEFRVFASEFPNLAASGTATSSSQWSSANAAAAGNDDLNATIWASAIGDPQPWWQVDFGVSSRIRMVEMMARQDMDQPGTRVNFEVRGSENPEGTNYTVLASQGNDGGNFPSTGTWAGSISSAGDYRYLRVVKTDGAHFNLAEFRAYGTVPASNVGAPTAWLNFESTLVDQAWQAGLHNGSAIGGASFDTAVPNVTAGSHSLLLPNTSASVSLRNASDLNLNDGHPFTMALWFRLSDSSSWPAMVMKQPASAWDCNTFNRGGLMVNPGGHLHYDVSCIGGVDSTGVVNDGQWHHGAVIYDGVSYQLFVDGEPDGFAVFGGCNEGAHGEAPWQFNIGYGMVGNVDEFMFWNSALGQAQITEVCTQGLTTVPPTLAIARSGTQVLISWDNPLFVLQQNLNLADSGSWTYLGNGSNAPVTLVAQPGAAFIRAMRR